MLCSLCLILLCIVSFRTQEEALQNSMRRRRPEPHVQRVPSRRYLRRVSSNDAEESVYVNDSSLMMTTSPIAEENGMVMQGRITKTVAPEPVRRSVRLQLVIPKFVVLKAPVPSSFRLFFTRPPTFVFPALTQAPRGGHSHTNWLPTRVHQPLK